MCDEACKYLLCEIDPVSAEDEEVAKYMNGANSEQNKHDYFKKQFDKVILDLLKDRFDFYKKLDENSGLKTLIFDKIYKDYRDNKNT